MATPQIKEILVTTSNTVMLYFDGPLDAKVAVPRKFYRKLRSTWCFHGKLRL
jgi:hypothetical protein